MQMSDEEIRREYKAAKYKKKQIGILAQLNCCSADEIKAIVRDSPQGNLKQPQKPDVSSAMLTSMVQEKLAEKLDALDKEIRRLEGQYKEITIAMKVIGELESGKETHADG